MSAAGRLAIVLAVLLLAAPTGAGAIGDGTPTPGGASPGFGVVAVLAALAAALVAARLR